MSFVTAAMIGAGGALLGGVLSSRAASSAAGTQAAATDRAAQLSTEAANRAAELQQQTAREQMALQERIYNADVARQQPWLAAGQVALNKLIPESTNYTPFGMDQFQADPGYGFRLSEGQKALERSAAAKGGLLSGATGKNLLRYGQEMGSQEYQNAFNRYQAERQSRLGPLQSLAGVGQTANQALGAAGQNYMQQAGALGTGTASNLGNIYASNAANVGNLLTSGAAARASGYVGGANALSSALGGAGNMYMQSQLLNRLLPAGGGLGYGSGYAGAGPIGYAP